MKAVHLFVASLALGIMAAPASAHPALVSATPAAKSTVAKPKQITLTFSEALIAPASGVDLTMTGMPGMANHPPMKINGIKTSVKDGKTLVATLGTPLEAGTYKLDWHVVSVDTHRVTGSYSFTVR